jgi:cytidine deaminase
MLCREYLSSLASPTTPIIMASALGDKISKCELGQLHPSPYIYRQQLRNNVTLFAKKFSKNLIDPSILNENASNLYKKAIEFTKYDNTDSIHPIRLAAAVLFSNGNIDISWQMKGLEYGCTLCPVAQLIHSMEKYRVCGICSDFKSNSNISTLVNNNNNNNSKDLIDNNIIKPIMIVMVDQHGICHAPFAQCRSLLNEYCYGEVEFIVHNELSGIPELIKSISLSPSPPNGKLLTHDDFDISR